VILGVVGTFNREPLELMRFCNSLIVLRSAKLIMVDSMLMLRTRAVSATPFVVRKISDSQFSPFRAMTKRRFSVECARYPV
jgi:hypothetical protein